MQIQQVVASFLASSSLLKGDSESQEVAVNEDFAVVDSNMEALKSHKKSHKKSTNHSNHSNETSSNAGSGAMVSNAGALAVAAGLVAFLL
jgi:mannitol-specific phosphotransferase system IIBC component